MQRGLKIFLKTIGWILLSALILIAIAFFAIQVPGVQNFAKNKAVNYLKKKTGTELSIGSFRFKLFNSVELNEVYVEDLHKDTLLYAKKLEVHLNMLDLLKNDANVKSLELTNAYVKMNRTAPDTVFNFQFIIDAFAPADKVQKDSTVADFVANIKALDLNNTRLQYRDDVAGSEFAFKSANLSTQLEKFDLRTLTTIFGDLNLEDAHARIRLYNPTVFLKSANILATGTKETKTTGLPLGVGDINFKKISVNFVDEVASTDLDFSLRTLVAKPKEVELDKMHFHLSDLILDSSKIIIARGKPVPSTRREEPTDDTAKVTQWKFLFDKVDVSNTNFSFDDKTKRRTNNGIDYAHLNIKDFNLFASQVDLAPVDFKGVIDSLSLKEQSGLVLRNAHTRFAHNDKFTSLGNLLLQTNKSIIRDSVHLSYKSLNDLGKNPGNAYIYARLPNNRIAVSDILLFAPQLRPQLGNYSNSIIRLNSTLKGYLRNLDISTLELSGIGNTEMNISGVVRGLPDFTNAYFDLKINKLATTRNDILNFLPKGAIPPNTVRIPNNIRANGFIRGNMRDFATQMNILTTNGNANITANLNENGRYSASIRTTGLDVGHLFYQEKNVGRITANIRANGYGLSTKKFNLGNLYSKFSGNVSSAYVKGYNYNNFTINGTLSKGIVQSVSDIRDENLAFNLVSTINLNSKYPAVQAELVLDTLNAKQLGFMKTVLNAKMKMKASFTNTNPDYLNGTMTITDMFYRTDSTSGYADSLVITAINQGEYNQLYASLDSSVRINLRGNYKLTQLPSALQATINKYYRLPDYRPSPFSPQQLELDGIIIPDATLTTAIPAIAGSDTLTFSGSYASAKDFIQFNARSNKIVFNENNLANLAINLNTENDSIKLAANVDNISTGNLKLNKTGITGSLANNNLVFNAATNDAEQKPWYAVGGTVTTDGNAYKLSLNPDGLMLNYDQWNISPDNYLRYSKTEGVHAHNFTMSSGEQSLSLNSANPGVNAPLNATFKNFHISTITQLANQTSLPLEGTINGTAQVRDLMKQPLFVSDLRIDNLAYNKDTIGNLAINVDNNKASNIYSANIVLTGKGNDASITGDYYAATQSLDMLVDLRRLNLESLKSFGGEQISDMGGFATARLKIDGTVTKPEVNGNIHFDSAYVVPFMTGERLTLKNQTIHATPQGFRFNKFTLTDTRNSDLTINGYVATSNYKEFNFDLDINADDFLAVNAEAAAKRLFFGQLNIDASMKLMGNIESPYLRGNVRVNENTDFSMVLPGRDPEIEDREGVVVFVKKEDQLSYLQDLIAKDSATNATALKGLDLFLNVETDTAAQLSLVIDERTGDALTLKGLASIDFGIDRSGKMSMTGNYVLTHGYYNLSFAFIRKKFEILPGSSIVWTGDPLTANIDIDASLPVQAAAIDLIAAESGGNVDAKYNQLLPFEVMLDLNGELMKPVIKFDIVLPEETSAQWPLVETKLQEIRANSSEMNKQVFALMLLGRFVGPNPLQSAGEAMNIGAMAKQSVSKLLTQELNKLADGLIKEVDLNFGINTGRDYSTGKAIDRTDLTVGISKRLLNDRLTINVGSSFALGGTAGNQAATNIAGDVSVEYKLTDDGKYLIRAYRKNIYEGVIEGQVVRTGVAFALTLDYDQFREIFERPENAKFYRKKRKAQQKELRNKKTEAEYLLNEEKKEKMME